MAGVANFIERAKRDGADRRAHWEIKTVDGTSYSGEVVAVYPDCVVLSKRIGAMRSIDVEGDAALVCIAESAILYVQQSAPE